MFRALSVHLQEGTVVHMQHMVLSLSTRVRGGLSVHSLSEFSLKRCTDRPPVTPTESDSTICCMCTTVSSWRWALEDRNMQRKIVFYE